MGMHLYYAKNNTNKKLSFLIREENEFKANTLLYEYCDEIGLRVADYTIIYERQIVFESNMIPGIISLYKSNYIEYEMNANAIIHCIGDLYSF